jgi:hypothetical protein
MSHDEDELKILQDPATWDWDSAETHPPVENPGMRITIRAQGADLRVLTEAAEAAGMTLPAYVLEAALKRARAELHAGSGAR